MEKHVMAMDYGPSTIDFFLSETRDVFAARTFFRKALAAPGHPRPRVINVDGNPSYPRVVDELKRTHALGGRCRCRVVPYLNNLVEQDHRAIKRRINASLGFRSFAAAERTIQGYEAMQHDTQRTGSMVGKGRWGQTSLLRQMHRRTYWLISTSKPDSFVSSPLFATEPDQVSF